MCTCTVTVKAPGGLHARLAHEFVSRACEHRSTIYVEHNGQRANAKSLLNLFALGIFENSEISIIAHGDDEEQAVASLSRMV